VRTVPGSLVEMEDEKQLRILNQLFIPLSQAMPAIASSGDQQMIAQAAKAMQYIVTKQIELSGSAMAKDLGLVMKGDIEASTRATSASRCSRRSTAEWTPEWVSSRA
jgi:hypothetical protein